MTTLEGLDQLMKGIGNFGDALKKLKNKKEAHKILLDIGYSPQEAKYYAQHLSPHDILNLKVKSDLQKGKEQQAEKMTEAERKALETYNIPGLAEASPKARKAIVKAIEERGALGKGWSGFKESLGAEPWKPWKVNYTKEGQPGGIVIGTDVFNAEDLGPAFMQGNLLLKGGVKEQVSSPYSKETITEKPIRTAQGTGEQITDTQQFRTPFGSQLQEAGKIVGPAAVGAGAQLGLWPGALATLPLQGLQGALNQTGFGGEAFENRREEFRRMAEQNPENREFYHNLAEGEDPTARLQTLLNYAPTPENAKRLAGYLGEKVGLGEYVTPSTETAKNVQNVAETAALIGRGKTLLGGSEKFIPRAVEAGTAALGAKLGGKLAEAATESPLVGALTEGGLGAAYGIFPGTFGTLYKKEYGDFQKNVLNPAKEKGLTVDMKPFKEKFNEIYKDIAKLRPETDTAKQLQNQAESLKNFINGKVTPEALMDSYRRMGEQIRKKDTTALGKKYLTEMIDLQKNALKNFSEQLSPGSSKTLKAADSIFKAQKDLNRDLKNWKTYINVRNAGIGAPLYLVGGYPYLIGGTSLYLAQQYAQRLAQVPSIRATTTRLLKEAGAKHALNVQKLTKQLDNQVEKEVAGWPQKEQQEIRSLSNEIKQKELAEESKKKKR